MGDGGLKGQWGVGDPAPGGSDEQSNNFKAQFQQLLGQINEHLQYTAAHAEKSKHDPLAARRDALTPAFQAALSQIDPKSPAKAKGAIDGVLSKTQALLTEVAQFRQVAEKDFDSWQEHQPKFDEAVHHIEELEAWEDPKAPTLRAITAKIQTQVDARQYAMASKALDELLPKLDAIYEEYLKQKAAKEEYEPKLADVQPRLTAAAVSKFKKLQTQQDEMAGLQKTMEGQAAKKDFVQALQQIGELGSKVDAYEAALKELEEQKSAYDEAAAAIQPRLQAAASSEPQYAKLGPQQAEITAAQTTMEASAQAEDFVPALTQAQDLGVKLDALDAAKTEIDRQKKEYEAALAALQPKLDQVEHSTYKKLEPNQQDIATGKAAAEAAAQQGDYEQATSLVGEVSGKCDEYLEAFAALEQQRKAYEDAWNALQPRSDQAGQSEFKKFDQQQQDLTSIKAEIDSAVEAEDFEAALGKVNDLSQKVDQYLADLDKAKQQRQAYEEAWATVGPKLAEAQQDTSNKLGPQRDELSSQQQQVEAAVQEEDFEKALSLVNDLGTRADTYLEASKAQAEQKARYETALASLQPELDEVARSGSPALAPLNEEIGKLRAEMESAAKAEDYEQATAHVDDLTSKIKTYKDELARARQDYEQKLTPIDTGMKDVLDCGFSELEAKKGELKAAYEAMTNLALAEDYKGASAAADALGPQVSNFGGQRQVARGKVGQKVYPRINEIEAGMKEFERETTPLKDKINALVDSIRLRSNQGDSDFENAAKDMEQLNAMFAQLKDDPCLKAKRSPEYVKAVEAFDQAKADAVPLWTALEKSRSDTIAKPFSGQQPDPNQDLIRRQAEEAVKAVELKKFNASKEINRVLSSYKCPDRVLESLIEPTKWP